MTRGKTFLLTGVIVSLIILSAETFSYASGFSCNGRVISIGSSIYKVLKECGEPSYKYARNEEDISRRYEELNSRSNNSSGVDVPGNRDINRDNPDRYLLKSEIKNINIEEWTYNYGPTRLLHTLIFENAKLIKIKTGGYGYTTGDIPASRNRKCSASKGDLIAEVLLKCSEPAFRERRSEEKSEVTYLDSRRLNVTERRVFIDIEEWTYNTGATNLIQILIFKNNRLESLQTGEYGN